MTKRRPTDAEWSALADKASEAGKLLDEVKLAAALLAFECEEKIALPLLDQIAKQLDGACPASFANMVRPYSQWAGGESWNRREPQICKPQLYFAKNCNSGELLETNPAPAGT